MAKAFWEIYESMTAVDSYANEMRTYNSTVLIENDSGYWNLKIIYSDANYTYRENFLRLEDLEEFLHAALIGVKIGSGTEV